MAAKVTEMLYRLMGKDDGAGAAMRSVGKEADSVAAKVRAMARGGDQGAALKSISRLLRGGGAAMGVTLVAKGINDLAEAMHGFADASREGDRDYGALMEKMAGSIPILGQVWTAGRNLRSAIQDMTAEDIRTAGGSESDIRDAMSDETLAKVDKANDETIKALGKARQDAHARTIAAAKEGFDSQRQAAQDEFNKTTDQINDWKTKNKTLWESQKGGAAAAIRSLEVEAAATLAEKNKKILTDETHARMSIIEASERAVGDARSKAIQDRLRTGEKGIAAENQNFKAEAEAIRHGYNNLISTAISAAKQQADKDPAMKGLIMHDLGILRKAYDAEASAEIGSAAQQILKARGERIAEEMRKNVQEFWHHADTAGELADLHLQTMKRMSDGTPQQEADIKRAEIAAQYRKEHEQILKILQDENETNARKVQATKQEAEIRAAAEKDLKRLRMPGYGEAPTFEIDTNVGASFFAPQPEKFPGLPGTNDTDRRALDDAGKTADDATNKLLQGIFDSLKPETLTNAFAAAWKMIPVSTYSTPNQQ